MIVTGEEYGDGLGPFWESRPFVLLELQSWRPATEVPKPRPDKSAEKVLRKVPGPKGGADESAEVLRASKPRYCFCRGLKPEAFFRHFSSSRKRHINFEHINFLKVRTTLGQPAGSPEGKVYISCVSRRTHKLFGPVNPGTTSRLSQGHPDVNQSKKFMFMCLFSPGFSRHPVWARHFPKHFFRHFCRDGASALL